jgi:hypothetical protein
MLKNLVILTIIVAAGCTAETDKKESENATPQPIDSIAIKSADAVTKIDGCYMQVLKRDTFTASLQQNGNFITGKMSFDNYEKDASSGNISGKREGDILKLNYTFMSEGMNSVMELYFKHKDGVLLRGTGDMGNKGDTAYFKNPGQVKYEDAGLKKVDCGNLAAKYK